MFLYRHSRLAGSRDLDNWAAAAASATRATWKEHVVQPLLVVRDELFKTFRE
jgi:nuclear-control-of-ATPase protein 2